MYVIREAQEHHRNVEVQEGMPVGLSMLSSNQVEKLGWKDASITWPNLFFYYV